MEPAFVVTQSAHRLWNKHGVAASRTLLVGLLRVGAVAGQLVLLKVYAHRLSNHELGLYNYWATVSYALNALLFVPIDYYQQSRVYAFREAGVSLLSFVRFNKTLLKAVGGVGVVAALWCGLRSAHVAFHLVLCLGLAVALYVTSALKNLLNNLEHRVLVAAVFLFEVAAKIVLFVLVLRWVGAGSIALLGAFALALLLEMGLLLVLANARKVFDAGTIRAIDVRELAGFALPVSLAAVANWIQLRSYALVLVGLGHTEMVGVYATVSAVGAAAMGAVSVTFAQLYLPNVYKSGGAYTPTYVRNAFALSLLVAVGFYALAGPLVGLLTRHDLARWAPIALYGVASEAGNLLIGGLAVHLTLRNRTRPILWSGVIGMAVAGVVFAFFVFGNRIGPGVIGLPIALSQAVVVGYLLYSCRRYSDA